MEGGREKESLNTTAKLLNSRKNSKYCPHCKSVVANSTYYKHRNKYRNSSGQWTYRDTEPQQNPEQHVQNKEHCVQDPDQCVQILNPGQRVLDPDQDIQNPDQITPKRRKIDSEVSIIFIQEMPS